MGGLAIDAQSRALDTSGAPIAGLYAAGSATGGIEGGAQRGLSRRSFESGDNRVAGGGMHRRVFSHNVNSP